MSLDTATDVAARVEELAHRMSILEAQQAVRRLQHQYGYYLDKCLYQEVVDLFADDGEVNFCGARFIGKAGVRRLYVGRFRQRFTADLNGPRFGFLLDHPQHQDVITVAEDGLSAKGRFRSLMQAGLHEDAKDTFPGHASMEQWWEGGIYENEYVNDGGVWKFKVLNYRPVWHGEYSTGWAHQRPMQMNFETYPDDPTGPDEIRGPGYEFFPNTEVFPFHYPHPVTGETVTSEDDEAARHA
ncbi:nuclear transport factor 2 family protein [Georgenia deserti]|uniref:Nuclear transport factor 2 family protein n=1 Tax=Georgenia deserti TaxID=2093781 RepID=A0ABW4L4P8_9MICO